MYNRYIRNDQGSYRPIPPEPEAGEKGQAGQDQGGLFGLLRRLLDRLNLRELDTGDLVLLLIVFLLYSEGEDEELLLALALVFLL